MASIFERIAKRSCYPVEINGGTIFLREPTFGEIDRMVALGDKGMGLTLALTVVNDDGSVMFPAAEGEDDATLSARMLVEASILTPGNVKQIQAAVLKLAQRTDADELAKN